MTACARSARGSRRLGDAHTTGSAGQRRPVNDIAKGTRDPAGHVAADAAGLACRLHHRQADPRGGGGSDRGIGADRHREPNAGEPEDQLVGFLAGGKPGSFTHGIADVPEYEQIAEHGARQSRHVLRLPRDQAAGEAPDRAHGGRRPAIGQFHLLGKGGIDRDIAVAGELQKAVGEVGVTGRQRSIDLARRNRFVERARNRAIGERHRIVLCGNQRSGLEGVRRHGIRRDGHCNSETERQGDPPSGHEPHFSFQERRAP